MNRPTQVPIGLALTSTAKAVERAFDDALAEAGSSRPVWLVLMALKTAQPRTQTDLAQAVDIRGATLSHHLNAMEADGLVTRVRNPANRRIHDVRLTESGNGLFGQIAGAAQAHDRRLRAHLDDEDIDRLRALMDQLRTNIDPSTPLDLGPDSLGHDDGPASR